MSKFIFPLILIFCFTLGIQAQTTFQIKGNVISATDKLPLIGANIISVEDHNIGTVTDFNGHFVMRSLDSCVQVKVVYIGYQPATLRFCKEDLPIIIPLEPASEVLDEVVITEEESLSEFGDMSISEVGVYKKERGRPDAMPVKEADVMSAAPAFMPEPKIAPPSSAKGTINKSIPSAVKQKAGQLTAGEWNDLLNWSDWLMTVEEDLAHQEEIWLSNPGNRYSVIVTNKDNFALPNAIVQLKDDAGQTVYTSRTDNTGRAELWSKKALKKASVTVNYQGKKKTIDASIFANGNNAVQIKTDCPSANSVDVAFVVDATGSMSDEIMYLQAELDDVIKRVQAEKNITNLRTGSVFYRDHGDEYLTKLQKLSTDHKATLDFIAQQEAGGGGDTPEAVEVALEIAIKSMDWNPDAVARIMFFLLDAPPHNTPETQEKLRNLSSLAAQKGIRIIPIMASDATVDVEYLMRTIALQTNGRFLFLTNDSGIGNSHAEPSVGPYTPAFLNDLMHKVVLEMISYQPCEESQEQIEKQSRKNTIVAKCFPNPTTDYTFVQVNQDVEKLEVLDNNGKTIWTQKKIMEGTTTIGLQNLEAGTYFLRLTNKKEYVTLRVIVVD